MNSQIKQKVSQLFPFFMLNPADESLMNISKIRAGQVVFQEGEPCGIVAFLLKGVIRVSKIGKSGKEIYLYRVREGEACILMISSVLASKDYPATATIEEDVEAILLPIPVFKGWMGKNEVMQQFVYKMLSERLVSVMTLIEEIVFHKMDERVAEFLIEMKGEENLLTITHDAIAMELGTAREVISRIMKEFQQKGWVSLSRGKINILNQIALEKKAGLCDKVTE